MSCVAEPRILVAGASGYSGALAAALVDGHSGLELACATSRSNAGERLSDLYPRHRVDIVLEEFDPARHGDVDAAIVAYPHGASAPVVAQLRERDVKVVDLSADFRLRDQGVYEEWYVPHPAPQLIEEAVYGLPELYREQIRGADLVANPGCYPTAALLALAPVAGQLEDVVIDAKSGVSGAGREPTGVTHFVSVDENVHPYGVGRHRHMPEIDQELAAAGAQGITAAFTPHLLPLDQGELVSCYVRVPDPQGALALYEERWGDERFVELTGAMPGVKDVQGTNICRIHVHPDERTGRLFVFAAIDNLWKGAASQAVQNLNLMLGLDEAEGIAP